MFIFNFTVAGWYSINTILIAYNYATSRFSKDIVHELEFGDIAVVQIEPICSRVTGILILIGNLRCLKEVKTVDSDTWKM